jgi:hypothetical protein
LIERPEYATNPTEKYSSEWIEKSFTKQSAGSRSRDQRREPP